MNKDTAGSAFPEGMARSFVLLDPNIRQNAIEAVRDAPNGFQVKISPPRRNLDQNALLWELLTKFSEQLTWPVDGEFQTLSPDEWKDVLSAAFNREHVRLAQGLNGGYVLLGMRTSTMSKKVFSEFVEFIHAIAIDRGVNLETM